MSQENNEPSGAARVFLRNMLPSPPTGTSALVGGEATKNAVINFVDRDANAFEPNHEMASRSPVAIDGQRRISLSSKLGSELIDPRQDWSRIQEPAITILGIHLLSPHDVKPSRESIVMRSAYACMVCLTDSKNGISNETAYSTPHNNRRHIIAVMQCSA